MTPKEKRAKIKELENHYLFKVHQLTKEYQTKVKDLARVATERKIENVRKELRST